jgi:hypothetical protein
MAHIGRTLKNSTFPGDLGGGSRHASGVPGKSRLRTKEKISEGKTVPPSKLHRFRVRSRDFPKPFFFKRKAFEKNGLRAAPRPERMSHLAFSTKIPLLRSRLRLFQIYDPFRCFAISDFCPDEIDAGRNTHKSRRTNSERDTRGGPIREQPLFR